MRRRAGTNCFPLAPHQLVLPHGRLVITLFLQGHGNNKSGPAPGTGIGQQRPKFFDGVVRQFLFQLMIPILNRAEGSFFLPIP